MGKFGRGVSSLMCAGGGGYTKFEEGSGEEVRYSCSECGHRGAVAVTSGQKKVQRKQGEFHTEKS